MKSTKNKIKLLGIDLDGTLLDPTEHIPEKTKTFLIQLQKQGIRIVLCSGRSLFEMHRYAKDIELHKYHGFMIYTNGFGLYDCMQDRSHTFSCLNKEDLAFLTQIGKHFHLMPYAPDGDYYYVEASSPIRMLIQIANAINRQKTPFQQRYAHLKTTDDLLQQCNGEAGKLCLCGKPSSIRRMKQFLDTHAKDKYNLFSVSSVCIEINQRNVDKAQALLHLCRKENIQNTEVIVFGNSANDRPLFISFPHSVAMKNADTITKQFAFAQTNTNKEEGVRHYLQTADLFVS